MKQGQTAAAEPLYLRGIELLEGQERTNLRELGAMYANLASIYASEGRHDKAQPLFERSIHYLTKAYGMPSHPVVARIVLRTRRNTLEALGRPAEAESMYEEALAISDAALDANNPVTARTLDTLALLLFEQGEHDRAEALLRRAIAIRERDVGSGGGDLGASIRYLGATFQARNAFPAAEEQYERAKPLLEAALGTGDRDYGFFLRDLGQVYAAQNKLMQAETAYGRSLSEGQDVRGDAVEEPAVVGDHHGAAGERSEGLLERAQGVDVEVVGRLVEEQDVAAGLSMSRQVDAVALAAGERPTRFLLIGPLEVEASPRRRAGVDLGACPSHTGPLALGDHLPDGLRRRGRRATGRRRRASRSRRGAGCPSRAALRRR